MRPGRCCQVIGVAVLSVLFTGVSTRGQDLSVTGFVDRTSIRRGDGLHVTLVLGNPGEKEAHACEIQVIAGAYSCSRQGFSLAAKEEYPVTCTLTPTEEGQVNVVALVSWKDGGVLRAETHLVSQVNVSPREWIERRELQVFGATAVVAMLCVLGLVTWRLRRPRQVRPVAFRQVRNGLLGVSVVTMMTGLLSTDGTLAVSGSVLLLVSGLLVILGEKETKRLLRRVQKAGPVEFSAALQRTEYFGVVDAVEREFRRPETRLRTAASLGRNLDKYVAFYKLEAYSLESRLIRDTLLVPPAWPLRKAWLDSLSPDVTATLGEAELKKLKRLCRVVEGYHELRELFSSAIDNLIKEAETTPAEAETRAQQGIDILNDFREEADHRDFLVPPHCLAILANLQLAVGKREAAFATLYRAQSQFPETFVSNYLLAFYLRDLADDNYNTVVYADKAIEAVCQMQDSLEQSYLGAKARTRAAPMAPHLRAEVNPYEDYLKRDLGDWLRLLRHEMENLAAYAIASAGLVYREDDARRYAESAVASSPTKAEYMDTLGLVKLTFGVVNRDREEVREALKLFNRAAHYFEQRSGDHNRRLIRLHQRKAAEALRSAEEWD